MHIGGVTSVPATVDEIPDDILQACFARLPLRCLARVQAVCRRWQRLADAAYLYHLRKSMGLTQPCAYMLSSKYEQGRYAGLQITGADIPTVPDSKLIMENSCVISEKDLMNLRRVALLEGPPRLQFSATAAADGRLLYILGGRSPLISRRPDTWVVFGSVDVYDTVLNKWMQANPMQTARYAFAAGAFTCAADGLPRLVVAGGYDAHGYALASAELYDTGRDEWQSLPCMTSLRGACKGEFKRGKFYVKMANNGPLAVEAWDPGTLQWIAPFSGPLSGAPAAQIRQSGPCLDGGSWQQEAGAGAPADQKQLVFDTSPGVILFHL